MRLQLLCWAAWAALAGLLVHRLAQDALLLRHPSCDTTYLHEGYEVVPLGGGSRYRLVKFADGDRATLAARYKLQRQRGPSSAHVVVPVLFVHGHLGTHQQMRSAASETGRELARRAAADPSGWPLWMEWYAADFNAEASALDRALLNEQARFVLSCIEHLRQLHAATAGSTGTGAAAAQQPEQRQQPFRLVLVAYSMGGLVARQTVRRLAADASFDMSQLVALVTLGSPPHFPSFMPHAPLAALLIRTGRSCPSAAAGDGSGLTCQVSASEAAVETAVGARAAAVPRLNVLAGAGDFSLPQTHACVAGRSSDSRGACVGELTVAMRDVPAVWGTCSHKGIVSCNQLVRQLVPLLVDAAVASLDSASVSGEVGGGHASAAQWHAAAEAALQRRVTTQVARALGMQLAKGALAAGSDAAAAVNSERQAACRAELSAVEGTAEATPAAAARTSEQAEAPLLRRQVQQGHTLRLSWDARQAAAAGWKGLLLLATAAPPCSHWSVAARSADGSIIRQLASAAAPLPPLLPSLQQRWVPRHWSEVMRGIDWQHNSTRLLYVPFAGSPDSRLSRIDVTLLGSATGGTTLMAQALSSHPAEGQPALHLPPPGGPATLPAGHVAALWLHLPQQAWPMDGGTCAAGRTFSLGCLAQLLVGSTPPWNLRIQAQHCSSSSSSSNSSGPLGSSGGALEQQQQHILPALLAVWASSTGGADSVRVAGTHGRNGGSGSSSGVVQLWNGVDPLDRLLFVSDPGCSYALRLEWDVGGWLGLALRHLLFILPPLCMAASQARLSPLPGSTSRVAVVAAVLAAWGTQHPGALLAAFGGRGCPWVRLSAVEALAALLLAAGAASALGARTRAGVQVLRGLLPATSSRRVRLLGRLGVGSVAASCLFPPAVPACLGCLCLAVRLAAAANQQQQRRGQQQQQHTEGGTGAGQPAVHEDPAPQRALAWLVFYCQLSLLPAVELVSWLLGGVRQAVLWTDGRLLVCALALHACLLHTCSAAHGATRQQQGQRRWVSLLLRAAAHEAAACMGAAAALWGYPAAQLYAAGLSAAADAVLLA